MVWQKANRSPTSPPADSIRLFAAVSSSAQDASRGGSFHSYVAFLPISAWKRGTVSASRAWTTGNNAGYALGPASISRSASTAGWSPA